MQEKKALSDHLARFLGTGAYTGYMPAVPGTFGTLPGVALAIPMAALCAATPAGYLAVLAAAVAVAVWAAHRCRDLFDSGDPSQVTADEVVGYLVTVAFLPADAATLAWGFVVFRFFDIVKPPPVRQAEALPGGVGVVADDLLAGVYGNLVLRLLGAAGVGGLGAGGLG